MQAIVVQLAAFVIQRSNLEPLVRRKSPKNIKAIGVQNFALCADLPPKLFERKIPRRREDRLVEEVFSGRQSPLPIKIRSLVARLVVCHIDPQPAENFGALILVPAVRQQHTADVPEDRLNLTFGAHSPSGKSAPTVTGSHAAISFCQLSSLPRTRCRVLLPSSRRSGGAGDSTTCIIA